MSEIRWDPNIGKRLIKSITVSIGDPNIQKKAGYYCPTCNYYSQIEAKCPIIHKRYNDDKLLSYVMKRTNGMICNIYDARQYVKDMEMTFEDFDDDIVETYEDDMIYKPTHYVDNSQIIDHRDFTNEN
jgi:hypothetical protein